MIGINTGEWQMASNKFGVSKSASIERTMVEKIGRGAAIDISSAPKLGAYYLLDKVDPKQDYVDLANRRWIRSIGRMKTGTGIPIPNGMFHAKPGTILASAGVEFCSMAGVECVWQR